jgi:hypothetical protein
MSLNIFFFTHFISYDIPYIFEYLNIYNSIIFQISDNILYNLDILSCILKSTEKEESKNINEINEKKKSIKKVYFKVSQTK